MRATCLSCQHCTATLSALTSNAHSLFIQGLQCAPTIYSATVETFSEPPPQLWPLALSPFFPLLSSPQIKNLQLPPPRIPPNPTGSSSTPTPASTTPSPSSSLSAPPNFTSKPSPPSAATFRSPSLFPTPSASSKLPAAPTFPSPPEPPRLSFAAWSPQNMLTGTTASAAWISPNRNSSPSPKLPPNSSAASFAPIPAKFPSSPSARSPTSPRSSNPIRPSPRSSNPSSSWVARSAAATSLPLPNSISTWIPKPRASSSIPAFHSPWLAST